MAILIVDDSQHVHAQLEVLLKGDGLIDLYFSESASKAIELIRPADEGGKSLDVDLILMDIEMEEGMNGIEATRLIKSKMLFQDIPILMVTGNTNSGSLQKAFDAGAVDYITKPIRKVELLARVRSFLQLKQATDDRKAREAEKETLIADLQEALARVRLLSGLLPICASCKKIRDDQGYWNQIESYVRDHSEAKFSHGICPECANKLYPELGLSCGKE